LFSGKREKEKKLRKNFEKQIAGGGGVLSYIAGCKARKAEFLLILAVPQPTISRWLNENNLQIITNPSTAVVHFSLKRVWGQFSVFQ
jgi:hypothetical protein